MFKKTSFFLFAFLLVSVSPQIFSQETQQVEDAISPEEELFNKAQTSQQRCVTKKEYLKVIALYEQYVEMYPDDIAKVTEARYEIAYITFYLKDYPKAQSYFLSILEEFKGDNGSKIPEWIKVLSEDRLREIEKIQADEKAKKDKKQKGS